MVGSLDEISQMLDSFGAIGGGPFGRGFVDMFEFDPGDDFDDEFDDDDDFDDDDPFVLDGGPPPCASGRHLRSRARPAAKKRSRKKK